MTGPWDWITVAIFAGLIALYLHRSEADTPRDALGQYLLASIGCAVVNWLGNHGQQLAAAAALGAVLLFIWMVLKPLSRGDG